MIKRIKRKEGLQGLQGNQPVLDKFKNPEVDICRSTVGFMKAMDLSQA